MGPYFMLAVVPRRSLGVWCDRLAWEQGMGPQPRGPPHDPGFPVAPSKKPG